MLFLLNYNVGGIGNPVRVRHNDVLATLNPLVDLLLVYIAVQFLKALDILAANRIDDNSNKNHVSAHISSSSGS